MRRFVSVVALLLFAIPFGVSINGCGKKTTVISCSDTSTGIPVGQITTITLQPKVYGVSINQGQISQVSRPTATDCTGATVSVASFTYAADDLTKTIADINPSTGSLCGGTWNRNSGGGIADYTTCIPTGKTGTVYVTATANGANSNPLPIYVHAIATSVVLGVPSTDAECQGNDPSTNCSPAATNINDTTSAVVACPVATALGCCAKSAVPATTPYDATSCVSQHSTAQLAAKVYAGTGANRVNISCQVGHVTFAAQSAGIFTIDQNGVATAQAPGSTIVNATVALSGSSAGFFSTCPPADIALAYPGSANGGSNILVNQNNTQPITATVTDTKGQPLTGLALEYVSTTPITIPASSNGTVTPVFPGQASITAICQPPTCNTAPQSLIGLFGNGKPVTSKAVSVTTPGSNSTDLYIASTDSQYLVPVDFTQPQLGAPIRLPYVPNSMVITNDGTTLYLGSPSGIMAVSATNGAVTNQNVTIRGVVIGVSPDNSTIVVSDPARNQVFLYNSSLTLVSVYGGTGTHATFSPDSQTIYIAAGNQILVYSNFSGWKAITPSNPVADVAVTVPAVGAYFAGTTTVARGYCPVTTTSGTTQPPTVTNQFYPPADVAAATTDRLAATNDGFHIIGATSSTNTLSDIQVQLAPVTAASSGSGSQSASGGIVCPKDGSGNTFTDVVASLPLTGITPASITGILPTSDSKYAFITYTGTGGVLPYYIPPSTVGATGPIVDPNNYKTIALTAPAIAPVAGAVSADNTTIYVGTSGDSLVHIISTSSLTDTKTIAPALPSATGAAGTLAVPNLLAEKPRKTT